MFRVLQLDSCDAYNKYLRYLLLPFFGLYLVIILKGQHRVETYGEATSSSSRDWGLSMQIQLNSPFPSWILNMHLWSAVSLFLACLMQKELIKYLAIPASFKDYINTHRTLGYFILTMTLLMDIGGYLMGPYSRLDNFSVFNVFFALPWVIFIFGTYFTAQSSTLWLHRLFGNMLFKGAMSVPFSRLAGATLQKLGWEEASGYYQGIFGVAIIILFWELFDIYHTWKEYTTPDQTQPADVAKAKKKLS